MVWMIIAVEFPSFPTVQSLTTLELLYQMLKGTTIYSKEKQA